MKKFLLYIYFVLFWVVSPVLIILPIIDHFFNLNINAFVGVAGMFLLASSAKAFSDLYDKINKN